MTPTPQVNNERSPSRVSILARLVPAFSYAMPMLGAVLSSLLINRAFEAMRNAESAGIAAVAGGMAEANLPVLIGLYFAIFLGLIGIVVMVVRCFMSTTTASPSGWFFLIFGGISLIPLLLLWEAQSLLIQAISPGSGGIAYVASSIQMCLTLAIVTSAAFILILLAASLIPLPSVLRAKRNWAPLLVLVSMEFVLIGTAVAFQVRTSWFHQVMEMGRLF
jgi:hypothetical protein